jgi:hypothetical protein
MTWPLYLAHELRSLASERTVHTRFAETSLPNNFGDRRARSAKVPDLLNPLWHQSALATKPYATLLCLLDAVHLTLAPDVAFELPDH